MSIRYKDENGVYLESCRNIIADFVANGSVKIRAGLLHDAIAIAVDRQVLVKFEMISLNHEIFDEPVLLITLVT